ncbi:hypothetical protein SAY87_018021 [Trapa incisa]|uniref:Uncharacterized protein n=1 Tax=Trapa incisa TaxID=236973 RepID=A0AAN7L4S5_9MYRT|nr:hypothetical protein SAY87_018021 [Trapa incisa]
MEKGAEQPLLPPQSEDRSGDNGSEAHEENPRNSHASGGLFFAHGTEDIGPINDTGGLVRVLWSELKKVWSLAGPLVFIYICQYLVNAVPIAFCGHVSTLAQAALSLGGTVVTGIVYGIMRFLMAQSKLMAMSVITAVLIAIHIFICWLLMLRLGWGLIGAAVALDIFWWLSVVAQLGYVVSGSCRPAWGGFSLKAFQDLWEFARLSLASALMLCLELWYYVALIFIAGYLKDAEVSVSALSICINISEIALMVAVGILAATSVRVSNELGAGHPRATVFAATVSIVSSAFIGLAISAVIMALRDVYPSLFSDDSSVQDVVKELTPLLAVSIFINSIQPVLGGNMAGDAVREHLTDHYSPGHGLQSELE